jgi:sialate O-acetylesterase
MKGLAIYMKCLTLMVGLNIGNNMLYADVEVARIFSSNMVLQRDINVPVWGTADPGEVVTASIDGLSVSARADEKGGWKLFLPAFQAGGPYQLVLKGKNTITFTDVLFGDVWVASGQSNMEWPLSKATDGAKEVNEADYPDIRMFYVPQRVGFAPKEDLESGNWEACSPSVASNFSAVAYFFGRELHQDLDVPIGLINCNWGGTPAEAWTSPEMLKTLPDFHERVLTLENGANWENDLVANNERAKKKRQIIESSYNGLEEGVTRTGYNTNDWKTVIAPNWEEKLEGIVWIRKMIEVPKEFKGQELRFDLGRIANQSTVYFNGVELGSVNDPNFVAFTVPAKLVKSGKNVISLRIYNTWGKYTYFYGPEDQMKLYAPTGAVLEDLSGPWKYNERLEESFPEVIRYANYPASLYNGMLYAVIPYGIKGVVWYQGESNAGRAYQYQTLFQSMIQDWRVRWGQGYFPFLFVQLANYMDVPKQPEDNAWAELREAQTMALTLQNTGMAVTMDIGERFDIHPRNKKEVGHRLALAAKKIAYGQEIVYSGPMYSGIEINGNEVEVAFDFVGRGLTMKGDRLKGFQIAGQDKRFYWAEAQIVGGKVFVKSDKVRQPVAVRYNWSINMDGNLYNNNGLPASPFRTDDWPGITINNK